MREQMSAVTHRRESKTLDNEHGNNDTHFRRPRRTIPRSSSLPVGRCGELDAGTRRCRLGLLRREPIHQRPRWPR